MNAHTRPAGERNAVASFCVLLFLAILLAIGPAGCTRRAASPVPTEIWHEFSGENALRHTQEMVALGPRPSGSPALEQCRRFIIATLQSHGWETRRQTFTASTPIGPIEFVNLIARFAAAPANAAEVLICSHYDTKRFETIRFVGANDAGSSTGSLLELARVLALDPALAARVELVFFDGEEAVHQFTATDGLYGSRHFAEELRRNGHAARFKYAVVWDMIGERDLTITLPPDSPGPLARAVFAAADALGVRRHFSYHSQRILDDHVPLNQVGVPAINLIDFDFDAWHTAGDTPEVLSAESMRIVGAVTLYLLRHHRPD